MAPRKLDRAEIFSLLTSARAGRLLTVDLQRGEPYLVPVSFVLLGQSIYCYTEPGRKLTTLQSHPQGVALEIDHQDRSAAWSVLAAGDYAPVKAGAERALATAGLLAKYRQEAVAPIWARSRGRWTTFMRNLARAHMGAIRLRRVSGRQWG
ncbi:MAG: pyridoxamine 5'-phosphate oxidase family protein [Chloroflexota bacterium]|nr:pyridoxamine 5'-phosphate oxidase family protein [Chloroflexota bacterium]